MSRDAGQMRFPEDLFELTRGMEDEPGEVAHPELLLLDEEFGRRELKARAIVLSLHFSIAPTASALAASLLEVDRESRRVATAMLRRVPPYELYGRGTRLVPLSSGLVVERADPGSLDLIAALGDLYGIVAGQPLSFALNLAALLNYGSVALRAALPGSVQRRRLHVRPFNRPGGSAVYEHGLAPTVRIPVEDGEISVPKGFDHLSLSIEYPNGSRVELDIGPERRRRLDRPS